MKKDAFLILEVNGIGYEVFVSKRIMESIPPKESSVNTEDPTEQAESGQNLNLFCYLDVGERSLKLYGFRTFEELEFFKLVRGISGVGPKAALEISAIGRPEKIKKEIEKGNEKIFEGVPGIGKKKAQKIILELAGKLKTKEPTPKKEKDNLENDEAFLALRNLGFPKEQCKKALSEASKEIKDSQERVKMALQILGGK